MSKLKPPVGKQDHMQGKPDAPLILVEYGDFQCPYCGEAYPIVKRIQKRFAGKMAFVFRNFPLVEAHPFAQAAAVAAEAAGRQEKFWEMHDLIYENQSKLGLEMLLQLAQSLKLNMQTFGNDFKDPALFAKVESDFDSGIKSGVNGTPSFYINGVKFDGAYVDLGEAISEKIEG
jgi:protein-disulfide isomerase